MYSKTHMYVKFISIMTMILNRMKNMTVFLKTYFVIDVSKIISYRMHFRKVWKGLSASLRVLQKHDAVPPRGWNVCNRM